MTAEAIPPWDSHVAVVIPAYQAEKSLGEVLDHVLHLAPRDNVWVIDDGSTDGTASIARARGVGLVSLETNQGKGTALAKGLLAAAQRGFAWAITMDADGQHRAGELSSFLASRPEARVGIVVGQRPVRGTRMPWHRRFSNILTTGLVSLVAGQRVYDAQSGFRMYRTELMAKGIWPAHGRFEWEAQALVLCRRAGWRIMAVPITTVYGNHGSHMRLWVDSWRFVGMMGKLLWMR